MRPRIRPAEAREAEELARVHLDTWRAAYRGQLPQDYLDGLQLADFVTRAEKRFQAGAASPARHHLVVDHGERPVGFVSGGPTRDAEADAARIGEVYAIYLLPGFWGRGLGRELLAGSLAALEAAGFQAATLWVIEGNDRAERFYEAAGFCRDGARRVSRHGAPGPDGRTREVDMPLVRYRIELRRSS